MRLHRNPKSGACEHGKASRCCRLPRFAGQFLEKAGIPRFDGSVTRLSVRSKAKRFFIFMPVPIKASPTSETKRTTRNTGNSNFNRKSQIKTPPPRKMRSWPRSSGMIGGFGGPLFFCLPLEWATDGNVCFLPSPVIFRRCTTFPSEACSMEHARHASSKGMDP